MLALILVGVGILVWGFAVGYPATPALDNGTVDPLLSWAYIMFGVAIFCWVVFGLIIAIVNDPKSLVKLGIGLVAIAAICGIAYAVAPGAPALGLTMEQPSAGTLKLTDTILYLAGFTAALTLVAIVFGEIVSAIRNK